MINYSRILYIIYIFLFSCGTIYAQNNVSRQNLYWVRLMNQSNIGKKFFIINEIDNRRFYDGNTQHHTIQHNHLHYRMRSNVDVALGQTFSWQNPQFPDATFKLTIPEIRPFQELNATQLVSKRVFFSSRIRLDERFIRKNNGIELLDGYNFNMRYRLKLQYQFLLWKQKNASIKLSDELMVNSGKNVNFFDQNRIYLAYEHNFTKKISVEAGYLRWYQQRTQFDTYFQRDIVRLTIFNKINLGKH